MLTIVVLSNSLIMMATEVSCFLSHVLPRQITLGDGCGNDEFDTETCSVALADGRIVTAVANYVYKQLISIFIRPTRQ